MAKVASRVSRPSHALEFENFRGTPRYVRVARARSGHWWLTDPLGRPFLSRGVAGINRYGHPGGRGSVLGPYEFTTERKYGSARDETGFGAAAFNHLRAWHCNTLGVGSGGELAARGLWEIGSLGFRNANADTIIRLGGAWLPDVFDPRWVAACDELAAERCAPRRVETTLLGYCTDEDLRWQQLPESGPGRRGRPTLLQLCLSLEPSYAAYHAAWEFILAAHAGDWTRLIRDWAVELPNKEALRQMTREELPLGGPGYERDQAAFSREFAQRYFQVTSEAIRRHDPNHLVLGCRFESPPGEAILEACAAPAVDVLSLKLAAEHTAGELELYSRATEMPLLVTQFSWAGAHAVRGSAGGRGTSRLTGVERMLAVGRAATRQLFLHPAVVGYAWARWADDPEDRPPFGQGLLHLDDTEAREHTELWTLLNAEAEQRRRAVSAAAR